MKQSLEKTEIQFTHSVTHLRSMSAMTLSVAYCIGVLPQQLAVDRSAPCLTR